MVLARVAPEFAIDEQEARTLAVAYCNWRRHYNPVVDAKTADFVAFLTVVATVEGLRVVRVTSRRAAAAAAARAERAAQSGGAGPTIVPFDGRGA